MEIIFPVGLYRAEDSKFMIKHMKIISCYSLLTSLFMKFYFL